jgi:hypothetical protein
MTRAKKLKQQIRSRAAKTGERYVTARLQVLTARRRRTGRSAGPVHPPATAPTTEPTPPARSGPSDASVRRKTGHGLDHWFGVLDAFGAASTGHAAAARHLHEAHGVPGWHCQMITVAYERARGLRAVNQACGGSFQVSVSRVLPAPVPEVVAAVASPARRRTWLDGAEPGLAAALAAAFTGPKARRLEVRPKGDARLRYSWDGSVVELRIDPRPNARARLTADNTKLASSASVVARRAQWQSALDALKTHLGG